MSHKILVFLFTLQFLTLLQSHVSHAQPLRLLPGEVLPIISGSTISAKSVKASAELFSYDYKVINVPSSNAPIEFIDIEITTTNDRLQLSDSGLFIEGARLREIPEMTARLGEKGIQIVPVGARVPAGWIGGLSTAGRIGWFPRHGSGVPPGQTFGGFVVISRGIPGIRDGFLDPEFQQAPVEEATQEDEDRTAAIGEAILLRLRTIGPTAPPKVFDPVKYTAYMVDLKNQSVTLGWIKDAAASEELGGKLSAISGQLSALTDNKIPLSKGTKILELGAQFLQFVESNSCKDFDCPDPKPLTSEAYALLFFNMEYFLNQVRLACGITTPAPSGTSSPAPKRKK